jgi:hypothetical protein
VIKINNLIFKMYYVFLILEIVKMNFGIVTKINNFLLILEIKNF